MITSPRRAAALTASAVTLVAAAVIPLAGSAASATAHQAPPHRQLGVTTLSNFRVVLTATKAGGGGGAPGATVTAAGYRQTAHGWRLISVQRIGRPGSWSWFATQVCSLRTAQYKPQPSTATPADSITVKLLWGPAIGCLGPYTRTWKP